MVTTLPSTHGGWGHRRSAAFPPRFKKSGYFCLFFPPKRGFRGSSPPPGQRFGARRGFPSRKGGAKPALSRSCPHPHRHRAAFVPPQPPRRATSRAWHRDTPRTAPPKRRVPSAPQRCQRGGPSLHPPGGRVRDPSGRAPPGQETPGAQPGVGAQPRGPGVRGGPSSSGTGAGAAAHPGPPAPPPGSAPATSAPIVPAALVFLSHLLCPLFFSPAAFFFYFFFCPVFF